ncbi:MAG: phenylacetate-CoA oxygenase subunit PaaJ [Bacteroidetes bacterium]|nr:phenylacetate-CoA oxygenase subunit PaaJ [Bacteroidota bacterium]
MVDTKRIWSLLEQVNDPEVPVLSVVDLGIIRDVKEAWVGGAAVQGGSQPESIPEIVLTPTYSGCPAMDAIRMNIRMVLLSNGYRDVRLTTVLAPAWTTEWMSEKGKDKLKAYGIAPPLPMQQVCHPGLFVREEAVACPHCNSYHTTLISEFGSTACKSLYRCEDCGEPFDYFKCH